MTTTELQTLAHTMTLVNDLARRKEVNPILAAEAVIALGDVMTGGGIIDERAANVEHAEIAS